MQTPRHDLKEVARHFATRGEFKSATVFGSGHINDTYLATYQNGVGEIRYIHQWINHHVFKEPALVMENIHRVTSHQRRVLTEAGYTDVDRRALNIVPAVDGASYSQDAAGDYWRTFHYISGAQTAEAIESVAQAREVARAFGVFQKQLVDLPGPRLHETIPAFHDTPSRFAALLAAIDADSCERVEDVREEIEFAMRRESITGKLLALHRDGLIPERITHNDTKLNNVLLSETGEALCVIDLDTVMPGLALYDFGDMVRTATSPAVEDEQDLSKVAMQMPMFHALVDGYLSATCDILTQAEKDNLAFSGKLITFEIGLRFLTDYLSGDTYFRTQRPKHNLDRCRTQFALVQSIEAQEDAMNEYVRTVAAT